MSKKEALNKANERMGYVGLGMVIDYFIFRPIRAFRPLVYLSAGFIVGAVWSWGIERLAGYLSNILY